MNYETYSEKALRTLSPNFHGDKVSLAWALGIIGRAIQAGEGISALKRALYYGSNPQEVSPEKAVFSGFTGENERLRDILHGILGIADEAAELLEEAQKILSGEDVDALHITEEQGDLAWYDNLLHAAQGTTPGRVRAMNIAKLEARYPDLFTREAAETRDTEAEYEAMRRAEKPVEETPSVYELYKRIYYACSYTDSPEKLFSLLEGHTGNLEWHVELARKLLQRYKADRAAEVRELDG